MQWLKSRTIWTVVFTIILNILQTTEPLIDPQLFILINTVLGALAIYFRIDAKV